MVTPVIFRKWPESEGGDIIAIFPTELGTNDANTSSSYQHMGQHSSVEPGYLIQITTPAKLSEYADLLSELERVGYDDLKVVQRLSPDYLRIRREKIAGYYATPKPKTKKLSTKRKTTKRSSSTPTSIRGMR